MKYYKICFLLSLMALLGSCGEETSSTTTIVEEEPVKALPFTSIKLEDLSSFQKTSANWQIMGDANVDRTKEKALSGTSGAGVLINLPDQELKQNLFTDFEHGDIELELDVMMPVGSNSGLYFQGRYEVQLLDSWGVKEPEHGDIGGIYQRWDDTRDEENKGYEGHPPMENASKAPGLWQHFKIIFHAPKFDASGNKIKNANFEEVWLNGVLLHKNVDVMGSTRAAAFADEKPTGPLMIQGDHGPVAFKNIQYKLYGDSAISFQDITVSEFINTSQTLPDLDSLEVVSEREIKAIAPHEVELNTQKLLVYKGKFDVHSSGDYLFELAVNGGAALVMANDTILNLNGNYSLNDKVLKQISLQKGPVPFTLFYNKHNARRQGLDWSVEGPQIQKYSLLQPNPVQLPEKNDVRIMVPVEGEPITQRSFMMHEGYKRTHCIAVGNLEGTHFAYDLAFGSLLKVWSGEFLEVTQMWHSRGHNQLGEPQNMIVSMHGDLDFAILKDDTKIWPDSLSHQNNIKQLGYEFDERGIPKFRHQIGESKIANTLIPASTERRLDRVIEIEGNSEIWHKIAEGEMINKLPDGTFIVNDESYFIDFSGNESLKPVIRDAGGKKELILKIPAGKQNINYSIIW